MDAPFGVCDVTTLQHRFNVAIAERYKSDGNGGMKCKTCGTVIRHTTCFVSIHEAAFGASRAGVGEVRHVPLPYCPHSEGEPKNTSTCVHE